MPVSALCGVVHICNPRAQKAELGGGLKIGGTSKNEGVSKEENHNCFKCTYFNNTL